VICPVCNSTTYEFSKLQIPASEEGPEEYIEYNACPCGWNDLIVIEEIPF